jgi:nicotinamidase/pyrazinamidase
MGTAADLPPYSAFFDADKLRDTGLHAFLSSNSVDSLCLVGIPLDDAVRNTALDSLAAGYQTSLLVPCCQARQPARKMELILELQQAGVLLINP